MCATPNQAIGCGNRLHDVTDFERGGSVRRRLVQFHAPLSLLVRLLLPCGPKEDRPERLRRSIGFDLTNEWNFEKKSPTKANQSEKTAGEIQRSFDCAVQKMEAWNRRPSISKLIDIGLPSAICQIIPPPLPARPRSLFYDFCCSGNKRNAIIAGAASPRSPDNATKLTVCDLRSFYEWETC